MVGFQRGGGARTQERESEYGQRREKRERTGEKREKVGGERKKSLTLLVVC